MDPGRVKVMACEVKSIIYLYSAVEISFVCAGNSERFPNRFWRSNKVLAFVADLLVIEAKSCRTLLESISGREITLFLYGDVVDARPTVLELSALLEKQDKVLSTLLGELETCKSEVAILRSRSLQQTSDGYAQDKGSGQLLVAENLLEEIKIARSEAENFSRELEAKRTELSHAAETISLKQTHIDHINELMQREHEAKNNEFSRLNDLLVNKRLEYDNLLADHNAIKAQLKMMEDSNVAKEKLVNDLTKDFIKELAKRDEESKVLTTRLSVLADENMTLRTSLLALDTNELSPESKKLLEQQQGFITTLKSECEILMKRLVKERVEHRKERKQLKRQIRHLNGRLECFISGKQEITDV
uniref:Uncharacterized protein n=1 Tax=Setaria digitata TaxID=48799 RepID=A0A915PVI0_9BILA